MNGFAAVAAREIKHGRQVVAAGLVGGAIALVVPLLSTFGRHDAGEARDLVALILATAFASCVALVVGSGMITRELAERRHGFLFARPLSAGAIWWGKTVAAWLLAMAAGGAALLPAAVASRGLPLLVSAWPDGGAAAALTIAAAALLALVAFAHAGALIVRSRTTRLLVLDAVAALAVAGVAGWAARSLYGGGATSALTVALKPLAALLLVAPLAAGLAQVSLGRTDPVRGHAVLSAVLWGTLALGALAFAGYARWVLGVGVNDLVSLGFVEAAPHGDWVALVANRAQGRGDYYPDFLLDTASGRSVRLDRASRWAEVAFSSDGRTAAWLVGDDTDPAGLRQVATLDLAEPSARPVVTPIVLEPNAGYGFALSADGRRLAVFGGGSVVVHELPSGRLLAAARLPAATSTHAFFLPGGRSLRIENRARPPAGRTQAWQVPTEVTIRELDLGSRVLAETGQVEDVTGLSFQLLQHDRTGERTLVTIGPLGAGTMTLRDGRTGALLARLATSETRQVRGEFLADGRLAVLAGARLDVYDRNGTSLRTVNLATGTRTGLAVTPRAFLAGEVRPGTLAVSIWNALTESSPALLLVDVATGAVVPLAGGYKPIASARLGQPGAEPGGAAARLFMTPSGGLALLDPATATFTSVLRVR